MRLWRKKDTVPQKDTLEILKELLEGNGKVISTIIDLLRKIKNPFMIFFGLLAFRFKSADQIWQLATVEAQSAYQAIAMAISRVKATVIILLLVVFTSWAIMAKSGSGLAIGIFAASLMALTLYVSSYALVAVWLFGNKRTPDGKKPPMEQLWDAFKDVLFWDVAIILLHLWIQPWISTDQLHRFTVLILAEFGLFVVSTYTRRPLRYAAIAFMTLIAALVFVQGTFESQIKPNEGSAFIRRMKMIAYPLCYPLGEYYWDANRNGIPDQPDLDRLVRGMHDPELFPQGKCWYGDVNGNGNCNGKDSIYFVDFMNGGTPPVTSPWEQDVTWQEAQKNGQKSDETPPTTVADSKKQPPPSAAPEAPPVITSAPQTTTPTGYGNQMSTQSQSALPSPVSEPSHSVSEGAITIEFPATTTVVPCVVGQEGRDITIVGYGEVDYGGRISRGPDGDSHLIAGGDNRWPSCNHAEVLVSYDGGAHFQRLGWRIEPNGQYISWFHKPAGIQTLVFGIRDSYFNDNKGKYTLVIS